MGQPLSDPAERLWKFVRGDTPTVEFEQWVYDTPTLEQLFGPDMYLELISLDYRDPMETVRLPDRLRSWLDEHVPRDCECITWQDKEKNPEGYETANLGADFTILKSRTPWLDLIQCLHCGSHWYLATDTVDADYYLLRLTEEQVAAILDRDEWPKQFDDLEHVWPPPGWFAHDDCRDLDDWQEKHGRPEE
ncbi:MAG: hypothetical protein KKA73_19035 [Chloroflexi bacterium]|nr:hypothetical protein [Chloroflexota bacterium]MBU1749785.1 hypothetical protein [Chloroflexota bacterium]MBU1880325.1 hypothetical protein [Chloroflexota bacterium]